MGESGEAGEAEPEVEVLEEEQGDAAAKGEEAGSYVQVLQNRSSSAALAAAAAASRERDDGARGAALGAAMDRYENRLSSAALAAALAAAALAAATALSRGEALPSARCCGEDLLAARREGDGLLLASRSNACAVGTGECELRVLAWRAWTVFRSVSRWRSSLTSVSILNSRAAASVGFTSG